jgi:hypothetical protein
MTSGLREITGRKMGPAALPSGSRHLSRCLGLGVLTNILSIAFCRRGYLRQAMTAATKMDNLTKMDNRLPCFLLTGNWFDAQ